jgi:hypothetical protein
MDPNDETLNQAIKLIDPEGLLVPGTRQFNTIRDMLSEWIKAYGPERALYEAEQSAKFLRTWWKVL